MSHNVMNRPYNPHVLIGNWYEDRVLEEDIIKDYLDKKNSGALHTQKYNALQQSTNQAVTLTTVTDKFLHFGDVVLLECEGANATNDLLPKASRKDCILSGDFVGAGEQFEIPSSGTTVRQPTPLTAFVIRSVDGSVDGAVVKYGQPFAVSSACKSFYLHSDTRSYTKSARRSGLQEINFVNTYNHECDWVCTSLNPKFRLEQEGRPVPSNEKVLILHMKTNKALGLVCDQNNSARFEVVCNTFLNSHKAEEDVNHWKFVTNVPQVPH